MSVLSELMGGVPYEELSASQREEWASLVREQGFRICETCGGRHGDFCYAIRLMPNSEVLRKRPLKVPRDEWCNKWTNERVEIW